MGWPDPVEDVPFHGRGAETGWSLRFLPKPNHLWFYGSTSTLVFTISFMFVDSVKFCPGCRHQGGRGCRGGPGRRFQWLPFAGASHFQLVAAGSKGPSARHHLACLLWMWHLWESALKKGQKMVERGGIRMRSKRDGDPLRTGFSPATCGPSTLGEGKAWEEGVVERDHKVLTTPALCPISSAPFGEDRGVRREGDKLSLERERKKGVLIMFFLLFSTTWNSNYILI